MLKSIHFRSVVATLFALAVCGPAFADNLGLSASVSSQWSGNASLAIYFDGTTTTRITNPASPPYVFGPTALNDPFSNPQNLAVASTDTFTFHGSVNNQGTPAGSFLRSGGFVRDEVYFQTLNGQPGTIEYVFNLDIQSSNTYTPDGYATFNMGFESPVDGNNQFVGSLSTTFSEGAPFANSGGGSQGPTSLTVKLRTDDIQPSLLISSDSYLPYTIGAWALTSNGALDFSNTVSLVDVNAYQDGVQLSDDQFTIFSTNQNPAFKPFEHTLAVPEPSTASLMIAGLVGLVGARRWLRDGTAAVSTHSPVNGQ